MSLRSSESAHTNQEHIITAELNVNLTASTSSVHPFHGDPHHELRAGESGIWWIDYLLFFFFWLSQVTGWFMSGFIMFDFEGLHHEQKDLEISS